jgi:hypothetical protein
VDWGRGWPEEVCGLRLVGGVWVYGLGGDAVVGVAAEKAKSARTVTLFPAGAGFQRCCCVVIQSRS